MINKFIQLKLKEVLLIVFFICILSTRIVFADVKHVILVSFDGLRSDALKAFSRKKIPNFTKIMREGAITLNARTDVNFTNTLPNHTCMLTGRPVLGVKGHNLTTNEIIDQTIHQFKGSYIKSIFDVLKENHLTSAMQASKLKFDIYQHSYFIDDVHCTDQDDNKTLDNALSLLKKSPPSFMFIHFAGPDNAGHHDGWSISPSSNYMKKVLEMDRMLGQLLLTIEGLNSKGESTVLIVTADHGGVGKNHSDPKERLNFTIPFMVWGDHVAKGKNLYKINKKNRRNPGRKQVGYDETLQPIRNGEAANLALHLLGLNCVADSSIGCQPALNVGK